MATLTLQAVELTTSESTAPLNGPPSSADYNEYQRSVLVDLASLSDLINNTLLPLIKVLDSSALASVAVGIAGSTIYSDTTDQTDTFFNSVDNQPLVIADSLRILRALITQSQIQINNIAVQLASLESKTTNLNQNDVSASLASLVSQITTLTSSVSSNSIAVNNLQNELGGIDGSVANTGNIAAGVTQQIEVNLSVAYPDNNYTVSLAMEEATGQLQILSFTYQLAGVGLFVLVRNNGTTTLAGTIHVVTKHF